MTLSAALGRYPHTAALLDGAVRDEGLDLAFTEIKPPSRAFAPMVREGRYDVSEMAIATALMAIAAGKDLALLPVALAARFQEAALLRLDGRALGPADLAGARIGVRAYSQTTGMWLRGILSDAYGFDPASARWTTFEDAHVAEFADPPWVRRAPAGADLVGLLKAGELDAIIVGNDVPKDPALRPVFPDPAAAAAQFQARYGFKPVNHLVAVKRSTVAAHPDLPARLTALIARAGTDLPFGKAALRPSLALAMRFCREQGLMGRTLSEAEIWADAAAEG